MLYIDLKYAETVLTLMKDAETVLSDYYYLCSKATKSENLQELWTILSTQEKTHAKIALEILGLVKTDPVKFTQGMDFDPAHIKLNIADIKETIVKLKAGTMADSRQLFAALRFENTLLESKYREFAKTDDIGYKKMMEVLVVDTELHKGRLEKVIRELGIQ